MPSIHQLFSEPSDEPELNLDKLFEEVDRAAAESDKRLRSYDPSGENEPDGSGGDPLGEPTLSLGEPPEPPTSDEPDESPEGAEEEEPVSAPTPEPAPPDPLELLGPERRVALLALDRAMAQDPTLAARVWGQVSGEVPAPSPEPAPVVPEGIEEGTVAHQLWLQNVELQRQVKAIAAAQVSTSEQSAKDRAANAAGAAGTAFEQRYAGKLTHDEVVAVARIAGQSGVAAMFANNATEESGGLPAAYDQALEHVLWTTPAYRAKVAGSEAPPSGETPPVVTERKRKLTALSAAASASGTPSAPQSPLETRPDGRFTPQSRMQLVKSLGTQLRASTNE